MIFTQDSPTETDDPAIALTAAGAAYEMQAIEIRGAPTRVFRNGPQTLADVYRTATGYDQRVLCVHDGRALTYGEMLRKAAALAHFLAGHGGVTKGMRIAIAMANRPEWMIAFIAATAAGATAVLINSRGTAAEIIAALDAADVDIVIADAQRARALTGCDRIRLLIVADDAQRTARETTIHVPFARAIEGWETAELNPVPLHADDEALVMFTSGTTGGSKGVLVDQRGLMTGLMNIQYSMAVIGARIAARYQPQKLAVATEQQPSTLLAMPLFHSSGCYAIFLSNLLRGGKIVILQKWHAMQALELIEQEQIMMFSGSPTMLWDLLRLDRGARKLSSLLSIGVGGQALQPQLLQEIVAAFPRAILGGGYGMTEANGSVCLIAGEELLQRPTSSGRIIATADIKIVDEDGAEVACGEVGEICLRGAMLMRGYCKRPDDTAAVLRNGWLQTGDLGRLDAEGYLYVIDRKKDIVISGGENISCTEVEGVAIENPAVAEAAAFGMEDERLGEILVLAIAPVAGLTIDAQALKNHVAERLAIYKVPRAIMYCEQLPRNALGKVNRNELRRRYLQQQN
jgi:acyl-CoA synthetase (AMP-forming)/AMP-acid ligase II